MSRNEHVSSNWYDAPYGEGIDIESIELVTKMRGCQSCDMCNLRDTRAEVWVWSGIYAQQTGGDFWKKVETVTVKEDGYYISDVTDWITPNESGAYSVEIKNIGWENQDRCLWIDYVGLKITYYEMGMARIWNSLDIEPLSIPKHSAFNAMGEVVCTGGYCGNVDARLKYAYSAEGPYQNVPLYSGTPMYTTGPNPYSCGEMNHEYGEPPLCSPYWEVFGTVAGNYYVKMVSGSNIVYNETEPVLVSINPGVLYLGGSIGSNAIKLKESTLLAGTIECGTAPCGNVRILASYRKGSYGSFEPIGSSSNLSTSNYNPQDCGQMMPGGSCQKSWYVSGNVPGYYQIRLLASSSDGDVANRTYDLGLEVSPEEMVGVLSVTNAEVSPDRINVSGTATLSGTVSCSQEYCGDVSVYARSGGQKIESNGLGTGDDNPKLCYGMQNGGSCSVSWTLTGNAAGTYSLDILADSNQADVENKTSTVVSLYVRNSVGSLFFPFEPSFGPGTIEVSETANLNAVVDCDSDYCGKATALVRYDGTILGVSGSLKTNDQNPQSCESYPCEFSWSINGSESGSYDITLSVKSNESGRELFRSYSLTVRDPSKPSLYVNLGSLQDQYSLGNPFTLRGEVGCDSGNCGEVKAYAKYKMSEGDPWVYLSQATPLSTTGNPGTITLGSGESKWIEWTVNSIETGNYILGISADAIDPGVIDSGTVSRGIEIFRGADVGIEIQSPERGKPLARGDEFLVRVVVTESGYPMVGALVTASSEGFFPAVQLEDSGSGTYSGTLRVGNSVGKGSYIITVFVKKDTQIFTGTTNVYVDPELEVSLETDRSECEILDKVTLQGQVLRNGKPVRASIRLKLSCPSRSFKEIILETDGSGNYLHEYMVSMATPPELCRFELDTSDSGGNYNSTHKSVRIFPSESEVYRVDFLSPAAGSRYRKGDSVRIGVKVFYGDEPLDGADVTCMNPMLEENIRLVGSRDGVYQIEYRISKEAPADLWVLTCVAETQEGYFGRKSVDVRITPLELSLTRVLPAQTDFQPGDVAGIRLKLAYPDGKPFVNATVYLEVGGRVIYLEEGDEPGTYGGDFTLESQGVFTFDVHAEDQFGNSGTFPGEIILTSGFAPFNLIWFVLPFVVAVLLLSGVVWKRGRREVVIRREAPEKPRDRKAELKERIAELERKVRNIQKSKDIVEQEYYERKIDEKTFNRMIQNYEQEIIALNVEIDDLRKELAKS